MICEVATEWQKYCNLALLAELTNLALFFSLAESQSAYKWGNQWICYWSLREFLFQFVWLIARYCGMRRQGKCMQYVALQLDVNDEPVVWSIPDMVRVISWGFPAAAPEPAAEAWACTWARACDRVELLMVSVISWPVLPPATRPELLMTWLKSWEPAGPRGEHVSVIQLTPEGV